MSIQLPAPIDRYIRIENSGDVEALSECFAADAVVHDEGRSYEGLDAIKRWKAETKKKYGHTVTPLEVADRDGSTVLKVRLSGDFPGSPVTVAFSFVLAHGRIASLRIGG
jgi:hypothetical protein